MAIPYDRQPEISVSDLADLQSRWLRGEIDYMAVKAEIRRRCETRSERDRAIRFVNKVR